MSGTSFALRKPLSSGLIAACMALWMAGCGVDAPQQIPATATNTPANSTPANTDGADLGDPQKVPAAAKPVGLLVAAEELKTRSGDEGLRILDVRPQADYDAGHIPGAVHVDVGAWRDLSLKEGGAGLHEKKGWSKVVGDAGIDGDTPVVVYGGGAASTAPNPARIWWILKFVGVKDVGLLDGGWNAWIAADGEVSMKAPEVAGISFEPDFQDERLSLIEDLKESHTSGDVVVVDTRSIEEFEGRTGGRIPKAQHLEWKELLNEDGRYKSQDDLKSIFVAHGITPEKTAVTHCQTGGRASVNAFALELVGYGKVKNYYCGWSEWGKDEEAPREQGAPETE